MLSEVVQNGRPLLSVALLAKFLMDQTSAKWLCTKLSVDGKEYELQEWIFTNTYECFSTFFADCERIV